MKSLWKKRALFFLAGMVFALICGMIQFKWMDIVPYAVFDKQPSWLKHAKVIVGWLPWIACLAVLIFRIKKGVNIRVVSYFLGTAVPTIALVCWILFGISIENAVHSKKFNSEDWKNNKINEDNSMWPPRLVMVDDLMASSKLNGLTKKEVIDMLGKPGNH